MRERIEAGGVLTALAAAVGTIGFSQGWWAGIPITAFVVAGVVLVVTFANQIRGLERLPIVGSPRLKARMYLDGRGSAGLVLRVPQGQARTAMLNVKVTNPARIDVGDANVALLIAEGIRRRQVDHQGRPLQEGRWLRPTREPVGLNDPVPHKDYWALSRQFPGRGMTVEWWFKLRFKRPGEYRARLKIDSPVLYREFTQDFRILVTDLQGQPGSIEVIDQLLDEGEQILASVPNPLTGDRASDYAMWHMKTASWLPADHSERFQDAEGDGSDYGSDLKETLAVLCEVRRRMGGDQP